MICFIIYSSSSENFNWFAFLTQYRHSLIESREEHSSKCKHNSRFIQFRGLKPGVALNLGLMRSCSNLLKKIVYCWIEDLNYLHNWGRKLLKWSDSLVGLSYMGADQVFFYRFSGWVKKVLLGFSYEQFRTKV